MSQTTFVGGAPAGSGSSIVSVPANPASGQSAIAVTLGDSFEPARYVPGCPVCLASGVPDKGTVAVVTTASDGSLAAATVIGLIKQVGYDGNPTHAIVQTGGVFEQSVEAWLEPTNTQGLVPSEARWIAALGQLDDTAPNGFGTFVGQVGLCLTTTALLLQTPVTPTAVTGVGGHLLGNVAVAANGAIGVSPGIASVVHTGTGVYTATLSNPPSSSALIIPQVTMASATSSIAPEAIVNNDDTITIRTKDTTATAADLAFFLSVFATGT